MTKYSAIVRLGTEIRQVQIRSKSWSEARTKLAQKWNVSKDRVTNPVEELADALWQLREKMHNEGSNSNSLQWIDDDVSMINVAFLNQDPDGSQEEEYAEEGHSMTELESLDLLTVRFSNSI